MGCEIVRTTPKTAEFLNDNEIIEMIISVRLFVHPDQSCLELLICFFLAQIFLAHPHPSLSALPALFQNSEHLL